MLNNTTNLGTLWNGSPRFATQQQLLSTTQGLLNDFSRPSSITVSSFTTLQTQLLTASTINTGSFTASNFIADTLSVSTMNTVRLNATSISTGFLTTNRITVNTLSTGLITAGTGNFSNITGNINGTGTFDNLTVNNSATFNNAITDFTHKTLSNVDTIHSGVGTFVGCNLNLTSSNALNGLGFLVNLEANQQGNVATNSEITLLARRGNRGKIMLDARPGEAGIQGEIEIKATGGSPPLGAPTLGGRILLNATNPFPLTSISPSYVLTTADSILTYAGGLSPISGNYGYNYQQGLNGVNIVAGTVASIPNVPGTVYLYGTNAAGTGNSGGVRITNGLSVDTIYPYPTGFTSDPYDLILKGNAAGNKVSLSNVRTIQSDGGTATGFNSIYGNNIDSQVLTTSNFTTSNTGFISSLTVNQLIGYTPTPITSYDSISTNRLSTGIAFINQATINKITLPNTPTFSIEQQFFSTSLGGFNTISSATNSILSTSISLTTASLPEINLIDGQVFNNGNLTYWASTIVVARTTDQPILSNTLGAISPNTGTLVYRNSSGVPLVIYAAYSGGTTGIVIPQNSNWGFTYNGSYWDINQNPANVGGTYGTSFSMFQNYNNTTLKTPDIITLDSAVVNITGTLGNTAITTANITTATINQINASNITLANTPSYSIEQSFISTSGGAFGTISTATNYILSTSLSLTATTAAINPFIQNYTIQTSNVDYWASTIQVATDEGATPTLFNQLITLSNGITGQLTYRNSGSKRLTITRFGDTTGQVDVPSGSNYQFTWTGTGWSLNTNPTDITQTFGTSLSLFQTYNTTTLKTPDILTLDCAALNITGTLNGITIGTANIEEATANQIFTSNITMSNTPSFGIEQSFFSTTTSGFNSISSIQNLILSTSMGFTSATQEQQPFIPAYFISANNYNNWNNVIYVKNTVVDPTTSFQEFNLPMTGVPAGATVQYQNNSSQDIQIVNFAGGGGFTIFAGSNYRYTWNGTIWTENRSPGTLTTTYGTSFAISQNYFNTVLKSPDTITIDSANLNITGLTTINRLNLTRLNLSTINTSNLTATNATITNLNTVNENTRTMTYSTITGNPVQGTIPINQNTNYTAIGRTINLASNLQYSVFPNISSLTTQTVFNNTINYNRYPGGYFQLMPTGSVGGQVLYADGTITSPNPLTGVSWYSSIMGVFGGQAGTSNYSIITIPPSQKGEFLLVGTRDPYSQYQINIGGTGYQLAIGSNEYHKWTNLTGASWSSNLTSAVIYPTINTTDTASLVMQPGGLLNLNTQYLGFGNGLRVVSYTQRQNGNLQLVSGFGKAQVDNIPVQFQGKRFSSSDYNCTISFTNYGASQPSLATNQVAVNTYPDANGLWLFQLRLTTATIPGTNTDCFWEYQVLLTPRVLGTGTNSAAIFSDEPWEAINAPGMHLSSITASTMSVYSSENILLNAALPFEAVIGVGNIGLNASTNVDLMANYDINLDAYHSMFLTATSSITLSNVAGTAGIGLDETATTALFGSNVYLLANSNAVLSSSNVITIESLSTINTTSYNYYQAASNLTELHNENYSNTSRTSATHITPNFVVSTCLNSYSIKGVLQPMIQYGDIAGSSNNGSNQVVLPVPYSSINAYKAFATMEDAQPAEISCVRNSESTFTVYWANAHSGSHSIAWNTMGNVECGGGGEPPPSEPAAYNLVNTIYGDTGYFTWSQDGAPDLETVYVLQSSNDVDYATYTTADVYTPEYTIYSLPTDYYYKFYVSSHYPGSVRVDSSNSSAEYVFPM